MIIINPAKLAAELIDSYCITSPDKLNIEEIAWAEKLAIKEMPLKNYLGLINFNNKYGLITINSQLTEAGQKRFTLAHEMGHFFNEKDSLALSPQKGNEMNNAVYYCTNNDIFSGRINKRREDDANEFAAELLMHRPWFADFVRKREISTGLIKEIAQYFNVSLTAAALRYVEIGRYPIAVIYSTAGKVKWHFPSQYFPLKYIPAGYTVKKDSPVFDYFSKGEIINDYDMVPAYTWYAEDSRCPRDLYLYEQNVVMKNYNSVLTILWESEFK